MVELGVKDSFIHLLSHKPFSSLHRHHSLLNACASCVIDRTIATKHLLLRFNQHTEHVENLTKDLTRPLPTMEAETGSPHVNASEAGPTEDLKTARNSERSSSANSLVTVRLSGLESPRDSRHSQESDTQGREEAHEMHIKDDARTSSEHLSLDDVASESKTLQDELVQLPRQHRASAASMQSIREEPQSDTASVTVRSRSNSSGTISSSESAHLDWDELEKNESQAHRDEGSDEVSIGSLPVRQS